MAGFTDDQRERIRESLIETAHELLVTLGPTKTTIVDITEPVGIAKPTFYQFFDSKSALYVEILERELDGYLDRVATELDTIDDPQAALEQFFRSYAEFGEDNPFVQQTIIEGNYREIMGSIDDEQLERLTQAELSVFVPILESIQADSEGPISDMDPLTVLGLLGSSVGLMIVHRAEYEQYTDSLDVVGTDYYETIRDHMIHTLARGLTIPDEE